MSNLHSIFMHWCLMQAYLFNYVAVGTEDVMNLTLVLRGKVTTPTSPIRLLKALKIKETSYFVISTNTALYLLDLEDNEIHLVSPTKKIKYDSVYVADNPETQTDAKILIWSGKGYGYLNVSKIDNAHYEATAEGDMIIGKLHPIKDGAFIAIEGEYIKLMTSKKRGSTSMDKQNIYRSESAIGHPFVKPKVWKSFDAIYYTVVNEKRLLMIWLEDKNGNPGNYFDPSHYKYNRLDFDVYPNPEVIQIGEEKLLFLRDEDTAHMTIMRIPQSDDFRNLSLYEKYRVEIPEGDIYKNSKKSAFIPSKNYKGKPWILVTDQRNGLVYFKPTDEYLDFGMDVWYYTRLQRELDAGVVDVSTWSADIRADGLTEIFVGSGSQISNYYFKDLNVKETTTESTTPRKLSTLESQATVQQVPSKLFLKCLVLILSYLAA